METATRKEATNCSSDSEILNVALAQRKTHAQKRDQPQERWRSQGTSTCMIRIPHRSPDVAEEDRRVRR